MDAEERNKQRDFLLDPKRAEDRSDPVRKFQLDEQQAADNAPVTTDTQLGKVLAAIKEADMRVTESVNTALSCTISSEPDFVAHLEASALFFQRKRQRLQKLYDILTEQKLLKAEKEHTEWVAEQRLKTIEEEKIKCSLT